MRAGRCRKHNGTSACSNRTKGRITCLKVENSKRTSRRWDKESITFPVTGKSPDVRQNTTSGGDQTEEAERWQSSSATPYGREQSSSHALLTARFMESRATAVDETIVSPNPNVVSGTNAASANVSLLPRSGFSPGGLEALTVRGDEKSTVVDEISEGKVNVCLGYSVDHVYRSPRDGAISPERIWHVPRGECATIQDDKCLGTDPLQAVHRGEGARREQQGLVSPAVGSINRKVRV